MTSTEIEAALKDAREGLSANLRSGNAVAAQVMLTVIGELEKSLLKSRLADACSDASKRAAEVERSVNYASYECLCEALFRMKGIDKCPRHPNFEGLGMRP